MKRFLSLAAAAVVALAAVSPAHAVSAPLTVTYTLPTTACTIINDVQVNPCDNVPLTGANALTAVELMISTSPIAGTYDGPVTLSVTAASGQVNTSFTANSGDTIYVRVRARNQYRASAWSNEATKLVEVETVPGIPTNVTITLNIS